MHDPIITDRTRKNYEQGWKRFADWCEAEGLDPLDGKGETVASWLRAMYAEGRKPGTLKLWRVAVAYRYSTDPKLLGKPDPTKTDEVRRALVLITRAAARAGRGTKQANAMTFDVMERVLSASVLRRRCESPKQAELRHIEAEATLRLMFDCALRTDEMVRAEWSDLSTDPDVTTGARTLHIPVSKTDQNGNGDYGHVSPTTWAALQRWRARTPTPAGRISTAPKPNALAGRIRRLGEVAGVELSGHSARRGVATEVGRNGGSLFEVMAVGRWKDAATAKRYVDAPNAARNAVSKLYPGDHAEPDPNLPDPNLPDLTDAFQEYAELARLQGALDMAAYARLGPDDPEVAAVRARLLEMWPLPDHPPPDCERPGCPGLILNAEQVARRRWCSIRCQDAARNDRRRAARHDH